MTPRSSPARLESGLSPAPSAAELNDETLRDGVQAPSARHPDLAEKMEALHLMPRIGVAAVSLGLPASSPRQRDDVIALAREIDRHRLGLDPHCAARTRVDDLSAVADVIQRSGVPLTAYTFIGSSPIRRHAEGWSWETLLRSVETALAFAAREAIEVAFVTEDTTRSRPDDLRRLFSHAIALGVRRLVLCDTVGHASPEGTRRLVRFVRALVREERPPVAIDWHGHDDRGLGVANALAAESEGADRIHGTLLGVGERCGNASLDQIIIHQCLRNGRPLDVDALEQYRQLVSRAYEWVLGPQYPRAVPASLRLVRSRAASLKA